jgi:hypothetical protein
MPAPVNVKKSRAPSEICQSFLKHAILTAKQPSGPSSPSFYFSWRFGG